MNEITNERLKAKRQYYHQLLLKLGEEKYKEVILEAQFGVESTKQLTEPQLDKIISDTERRMGTRQRPTKPTVDPDKILRSMRNKCLLVLSERGIQATPKDWSKINNELMAERYQWIMSETDRANGKVNRHGLMTFRTLPQLQKLFYQLCAIRDNEKTKAKEVQFLANNN